jgi:hypothetical protein
VPVLFVDHPTGPANNRRELVAYAKANLGQAQLRLGRALGQLLGEPLKPVSSMTCTLTFRTDRQLPLS